MSHRGDGFGGTPTYSRIIKTVVGAPLSSRHNTVSTAAFGYIQRTVGAEHDFVETRKPAVCVPRWRPRRTVALHATNTNAHREQRRRLEARVRNRGRLDCAAHSVGRNGRTIEILLWEDDQELFAAVPIDIVAEPRLLPQDSGDLAERGVTREVPGGIVVALEVVDVEEGETVAVPIAVHTRMQRSEIFLHAQTVADPCQRIAPTLIEVLLTPRLELDPPGGQSTVHGHGARRDDHSQLNGRGIDRFGQVVVGTGEQTQAPMRVIGIGAEQDEIDVVILVQSSELCTQRWPLDPRHHPVAHHDVDLGRLHDRQALFPVRGRQALVTESLEAAPQDHAVGDFVVDDEHTHRRDLAVAMQRGRRAMTGDTPAPSLGYVPRGPRLERRVLAVRPNRSTIAVSNHLTNRATARELGAMLRLAGPLAIAYAGNQLLGIVDTAIVGRMGAVAIAGAGLGNSLFFIASIAGVGVLVGIDPLFAQALGAGDEASARQRLTEGLALSAVLAVPIAAAMAASTLTLAPAGIDAETRAATLTYLWGRAPGALPLFAYVVLRGYLQCHRRTTSVMATMVLANIINVPTTAIFTFGARAWPVFGLGEAPGWAAGLGNGWGLFGASVASSIVLVIQVVALWPAARAAAASAPRRRPSTAGIRAIFRVGWPVGLQFLIESGVFVIVTVLMGRFGPVVLAGHQIALQVASFSFTLCLGIASAATVRVGRAVGRGVTRDARQAGFVALGASAAIMSISAALLAAFAPPVSRAFTPDGDVVDWAVRFLYIAVIFQIFDGLQAVAAGVLRGVGDTRSPLTFNLVGHWFVGFPIGIGTAFIWGDDPLGLWWGLTAGLFSVSIALSWRFETLSRRPISAISVPDDDGGRPASPSV